jgi:anti-anti-sigma regulatory factor
VHAIVIDGSELAYVSSAGLRVFLTPPRTPGRVRAARGRCAAPSAAEVFEISGFAQPILDIRDTVDAGVAAVTA